MEEKQHHHRVGAADAIGLGHDPYGHAAELSAELIELQIKELQKALKMLKQSNMILAEEEPGDPVIADAIKDNIVVIQKKEEQIAELERQLNEQFPHVVQAANQMNAKETGNLYFHEASREEVDDEKDVHMTSNEQPGPVGLYL
jgi:hypothetical protein